MNAERVFNRTAHMTLWLAIADRLRVMGRFEAPLNDMKKGMISNLGLPDAENNCYACEYDNDSYCDCCPLKNFECIGKADYPALLFASKVVLSVNEIKKYYEMAIRIAMWPVREGVVCR